MAKVTKKETVTSYVLELTEREANYLEKILRNCCFTGSKEGDTVWGALDAAGIDAEGVEVRGEITVSEN